MEVELTGISENQADIISSLQTVEMRWPGTTLRYTCLEGSESQRIRKSSVSIGGKESYDTPLLSREQKMRFLFS
jgi:hypothetical protein